MDAFENHDILERDIQQLYEKYPYLIDRRFFSAKINSQYPLPSGFADIVIFLNAEIIAVELKIDSLIPKYVLQLNGYMEDLREKFPSSTISGILIGKSPITNMLSLLKSLQFSVQIKILEQDLPIMVKICKKCRLANSVHTNKCEFCSCESWLV